MGALISSFAGWLWVAFQTVTIIGRNLMVSAVNTFIEGFAATAHAAIALLPTYTIPSPGQLVDQISFLSVFNWLLPIQFFVDCMTMMVTAYLLHVTLGPIFRFTKLLR